MSSSGISAAYQYPPAILDSLTQPPATPSHNVWSNSSPDIIRQFFKFSCSAPSLYVASAVCRSWHSSIDHPSTFAFLSAEHGWRSRGKRAFIEKYLTTRIYKDAIPVQEYFEDKRAGILALHQPEPVSVFNWSSGLVESVNAGLLVSASSSPAPQLNVYRGAESATIKSDKSNSVSTVPLIREQLIAQPNAAAALAGLVNSSVSRPFQWSAVDLHPGVALFADSQTPHLYTFHWETKLLKRFSVPHFSAVTCVRLGLIPPQPRKFPKFSKFKFQETNHFSSAQLSKGSSNSADQAAAADSALLPVPRSFSLSRLSVSGSYDTTACVWDSDSGLLLARLQGGNEKPVWSVDIHVNKLLVAAGSDDRKIRIFQLKLANGNNSTANSSASANQNNNQINNNSQRPASSAVPLHGVSPPVPSGPPYVPEFGGELLTCLVGHTKCPMVSKFDPFADEDENWLFSAGYDQTIRKWDYLTGQCVKVYQGTNTVFALEILEHVLISTLRGNLVHIFDKETASLLRVLTVGNLPNPAANSIYGLGVHATAGHASVDVKCIAVSADGTRISVGNTAGGICSWKFSRAALNKMKSRVTSISSGQTANSSAGNSNNQLQSPSHSLSLSHSHSQSQSADPSECSIM